MAKKKEVKKKIVETIDEVDMVEENSLEEERRFVVIGMITYGGSFTYNLGRALERADMQNIKKIKTTWKEDWEKYLIIGKKKEGVKVN